MGAGRQKLHVPPVSGYWQSFVCLQQTDDQLKSLALSLQMLAEESDWLWEGIQTFRCSLNSSELNTSTNVDCISGEQELDIGTNTDCTSREVDLGTGRH